MLRLRTWRHRVGNLASKDSCLNEMTAARAPGNLVIAALVLAMATSCSKEAPMKLADLQSIRCQQFDRGEFDGMLKEEVSKGVLRAMESGRATRISFNIDRASAQDVLVSVYAARAGAMPLYHGKVVGTIEVYPSNDLFRDEGMDNFHFRFFDQKNARVCAQMQDGGAVYWRRGRNIRIEFLPRKELDADIGRPIGHRVHLE